MIKKQKNLKEIDIKNTLIKYFKQIKNIYFKIYFFNILNN